MGEILEVRCRECSHEFRAERGGGFEFEMLHCWGCGASKAVAHDEAPDQFEVLHEWCRRMQETRLAPAVLLSATEIPEIVGLVEEYKKARSAFDDMLTTIAGTCNCGGEYGVKAPLRCPSCGSTGLHEGSILVDYD